MPDEVVAATVEHFGQLDVLVNNAAWNIGIPFPDLDALTPEDLADQVVAFCRSDSVTGQVLPIDGGLFFH